MTPTAKRDTSSIVAFLFNLSNRIIHVFYKLITIVFSSCDTKRMSDDNGYSYDNNVAGCICMEFFLFEESVPSARSSSSDICRSSVAPTYE